MDFFYNGGALPQGIRITIGTIGLNVYFYSLCIVIGMAIAVFLALKEAKKLGINPNIIYDGVLIILPLSVVGTRLYYVFCDSFVRPSYYNWDISKIFDFFNGGLAIQGGIITAFISTTIYCYIRKVNLWKIFDIVSIGFLVAQFCGRWGNFFNREVYGAVVEGANALGWMPEIIRNNMYIDGAYRQPLFLYEGMCNLFMFIVLLIVRRKRALRIGDIACIYFIWYGAIRAILEPLRDPRFILSTAGSSMQSALTSVIIMSIGIVILVGKYIAFKLPYYTDCIVEDTPKIEIEGEAASA